MPTYKSPSKTLKPPMTHHRRAKTTEELLEEMKKRRATADKSVNKRGS